MPQSKFPGHSTGCMEISSHLIELVGGVPRGANTDPEDRRRGRRRSVWGQSEAGSRLVRNLCACILLPSLQRIPSLREVCLLNVVVLVEAAVTRQ